MRRRSAARRRLPSSRTTKNKRSFSSMIEIVMHILHHCNHEPALSARIEKTYLGNVDNKMKTRLSKSPEDAAKQFGLKELATGKSDGEMLEWVQAHSKTPRSPWEIEAWSAFMEKRAPDSDAETLAFFAEHLGRLSKTREDVKTLFELGELDDYVSFGGKA